MLIITARRVQYRMADNEGNSPNRFPWWGIPKGCARDMISVNLWLNMPSESYDVIADDVATAISGIADHPGFVAGVVSMYPLTKHKRRSFFSVWVDEASMYSALRVVQAHLQPLIEQGRLEFELPDQQWDIWPVDQWLVGRHGDAETQ
jgi:hypothetical protein